MSEKTEIFNEGVEKENNPKETKSEKKSTGLKTAAAVAGGVVAGNLAWGMAREAKNTVEEYVADSEAEEVEAIEAEELPDGGVEAVTMSDVDSDDMSFGEAFAAAREDVGAGGVFEYDGQLYNTYYQDEWENLSPEEVDEYWASVEAANIDIDQETLPDDYQPEEVIAEQHEGEVVEPEIGTEPEMESADLDGDGYEESILVDSNSDGEIDIVGSDTNMDGEIDAVAADTDFDGDIDLVGEDTTGDGQIDMVYEDTNNDGEVDRISMDSDGDGDIDVVAENGEIIWEEDGIMDENEIIADNSEMDNDDFDNDADMSEWA